MNPQDKISELEIQYKAIEAEIESKQKHIDLLKSGIKYDKETLKHLKRGIDMYSKQESKTS
jgi:peptidoglycan hydrolase CwlO-like protein